MAMLGLWGSVGRRRAWCRGSCVLGAVVLALGAGCSPDPAEPTTVVLKFDRGVRFAAVLADGTVFAADTRNLYVIPAKAGPSVTASPTVPAVPAALGGADGLPYVAGLARDLHGTVWVTAEWAGQSGQRTTAGVSGTDAGLVHRADGAVDRLTAEGEAAVPALLPHRSHRSINQVAALDAVSMLVATSQGGLSANGDMSDVIVWRVDPGGAAAAAGRVTPIHTQKPGAGPRHVGVLRRPAQDLTEDTWVPATSVDLQQVEVMLPLDPQRTLLVTQGQAPKDEADVGRVTRPLFVFVLDGDRLSRIEAPDVAVDVERPLLSPLAGGRALLVSGWVEADGKVSPINRTWSVVDPAAGTVRQIGQDCGIAVGDGSDSYLAISPLDSTEDYRSRRLNLISEGTS
jgi:hypothetical protein